MKKQPDPNKIGTVQRVAKSCVVRTRLIRIAIPKHESSNQVLVNYCCKRTASNKANRRTCYVRISLRNASNPHLTHSAVAERPDISNRLIDDKELSKLPPLFNNGKLSKKYEVTETR